MVCTDDTDCQADVTIREATLRHHFQTDDIDARFAIRDHVHMWWLVIRGVYDETHSVLLEDRNHGLKITQLLRYFKRA